MIARCVLLGLSALGAFAAEVDSLDLGEYPVEGGVKYQVKGGYVAESFEFGAAATLRAEVLDADGKMVKAVQSGRQQLVTAIGYPRKLDFLLEPPVGTRSVRLKLLSAGNPASLKPLACSVVRAEDKPLFRGIYDAEDPMPSNRISVLADLAKIPPPKIDIVRRGNRNLLSLGGEIVPYNQYKGFTDYRQMGECGGDLVVTFNCGSRLFRGVPWDKANRDAQTGHFDFSRIEDNLIRIHHANPRARVVLTVDVDPDIPFLEAHPDSIFVNEKGIRGRTHFCGFRKFDSSPLDPKDKMAGWAYSYTSKAWRKYVEDALTRLCAFLKTTPASNIVIGFRLAGGMDGQFVQWQYGPENGHFDYSEANRRALCEYLRELYGTDESLRVAWGVTDVTLETARNPTVAEFKSHQVFDDRPGFGRRLADCRRFISVGTARTLNGFGRVLQREFGRKCIVSSWYSSTIWSQAGRLAIDELVKDGAINTIVTVGGYSSKRALDGPGCSADNSIAGLNLRGLLYVQEMDHRSWRARYVGGWGSVDSVAQPDNAVALGHQLRRDGASVIAAGGAGYHLYDMYGSWYHGEEMRPLLKELFWLNRFATEHAEGHPVPRVAIFGDEQARLLRENTYNNLDWIWRTSGVVPAIHYLSDVDNPRLPDYDLYIVWQPITINSRQLEELRRRASRKGKMLVVIGEAGTGSRDFRDTAEVLAALGMRVRHSSGTIGEGIVPVDGKDPLWTGISGPIGTSGGYIRDGGWVSRDQNGYAEVTDTEAEMLGRWEGNGHVAFARKRLGEGMLVFIARDGALTPRLLNNLSASAGIVPFSEPGNAVYVGNGIACVHCLGKPAKVDFGEKVRIVEPLGDRVSEPTRFWEPKLKPGESTAVGYLGVADERPKLVNDDEFKYSLYCVQGFVPIYAGKASLSVSSTNYQGRSAFELAMVLDAAKVVEQLYHFHAQLRSVVTPDLRPVLYEKIAEEGSRFYTETTKFAYSDVGKCTVSCQRAIKGRRVETGTDEREGNIYDLVSVSFFARGLKSPMTIDKAIPLSVVSGVRVRDRTLVYKGVDRVKGGDGKEVACDVFSLGGSKDEGHEGMEVASFWVSRDERRIPIRINLTLKFGSLSARLE